MGNLTETDLKRLEGVHPSLRRVIIRCAEEGGVPFKVLETVRTHEQCCINYGKGRTAAQCQAKGVPGKYAQPKLAKVTWLNNPFNSKHCVQPDGFSHAADLCPLPVDWNNLKAFDRLAQAMERAAIIEKVDIRWGADWDEDGKPRERGETDSPHFEI